MMTAAELVNVVLERFEGLAPMRGGDVDLGAIVMAVLEELERQDYIGLEISDVS